MSTTEPVWDCHCILMSTCQLFQFLKIKDSMTDILLNIIVCIRSLSRPIINLWSSCKELCPLENPAVLEDSVWSFEGLLNQLPSSIAKQLWSLIPISCSFQSYGYCNIWKKRTVHVPGVFAMGANIQLKAFASGVSGRIIVAYCNECVLRGQLHAHRKL